MKNRERPFATTSRAWQAPSEFVRGALLAAAAYSAVITVLRGGAIADSDLIGGPAIATARHLLVPAGDVGGWHYHPGISINVVKRGTVNLEDGCGEENVYTTGQAFEMIGSRIDRAKNLGVEDAEEYNRFVVPAGMATTVPVAERMSRPAAQHSRMLARQLDELH